MSRIFVTGSADGLGLADVRLLIAGGHEVVGHARSESRAADLRRAAPGVAGVVTGDLSLAADTRSVADQVNALGRFDAVIHNAAIGYREPYRVTADGHAQLLAVNVLAPYLLTALIERPARLVYLSSGMHLGGAASTDDLDWKRRRYNGSQAYSDSKLYDAVLAFAVARRWPDVRSNAVTPGWVATRMGGPGAPDDLELAAVTQAWLAVSDDPAATVTGQYFYHQRPRSVHPAAASSSVQDQLLAACAELSGVKLTGAALTDAALSGAEPPKESRS
jgi:NAD(P)-dependent dehydrogenase (short-subunit alcohol dehydrogenase family)